MAKQKVKRKIPLAPKTLGEAATIIARVGALQREIQGMKSGLNDAIDELKKEAMEETAPLVKEMNECLASVWNYAELNKKSLLDGEERRSVEVPTGTFGWRKHPPAVKITNNEKLLEKLHELKLTRFIRTVEEPDKQAMLKEPDVTATVKGVRIVQDETFFVKPSSTDAAVEESLDDLKADWEE